MSVSSGFMGQQARGYTHPMESDAAIQDPQLPFPSGQILGLYQQLFHAPARLEELLVAVQQVRGANSPQELELPLVLLEMERRRQEQEQVLWDLQLLTGAGLSLFWPRGGQFRRPWDEARSSGNYIREPCVWANGEEELHPRHCRLAQERDIRKRNQQLLEKCQAEGLAAMQSVASAKAGTEPGQRCGSPGMPGWAALGPESAVGADTRELEDMLKKSQREQPGEEPRFTLEPDFTAESIFREKGSPGRQKKRLKEAGNIDSGQEVGRNIPEFRAQGPYQPPSRILYSPETLKPGERWPLPELEGLQEANHEQERAETRALMGTETPRDHKGENAQSWREETSKVQREKSPRAQKEERPQIQTQNTQREETPRAQGEEILWTQAQREETPKVQRGEIPWTQVETPKVQREISQAQREETPKAHKGKIPQILMEETAEPQQGEMPQAQHEKIPPFQEREKQVYRQIFQCQVSQFLHSLEGEKLQFHEEEVSQFQKGDIQKLWGKENPQLQGEIPILLQRKETKQPPKEDTPLFPPEEDPQSQEKTILQPQRNKIPQGQGEAIASTWGREISGSLGKVTPQLQGHVRLGAISEGQGLPCQENKQLKTPAQHRLREQDAVKLGRLSGQSQQALGAAGKKGPDLAVDRLKDMEDGWFQPASLLPKPRAEELKQHLRNPPSKELVFLGLTPSQQENTLKRLLELQGEAGRRRQRDREQQRLRVQERLCITRNRRSGEDLLRSSISTTQPWMQGDVAQQRCALREQLEQQHKERTGMLQAQRERNTRNFQALLRPQKTGENQFLPALCQPTWGLRRVSGQGDGGEKGSGMLPDGQKSEVSTGQNYRKTRDLTNPKCPGNPDIYTHHRGSQLCPT